MSSSPSAPSEDTEVETYRAAWSAIIDLIKRGDSWSGRERNCVFLNCGRSSPRFAKAAAVSGLDFPDDGRCVAGADWDGDGDLDLWFRNRTAPRLRLMLNQSERGKGGNRFVAFRLEGTRGNRDGIGARVEVHVPGQPPLLRTLRAGEAFLSQSSKTLHFGLGRAERIESVTVRWPGGSAETFREMEPGGCYLLRQGAGKARLLDRPARQTSLTVQPQIPRADTARAAILLPRRVPLPPLSYRKSAASDSQSTIEQGSQPLLLLFWASWCPACLGELNELTAHKADIEATGLDVLALAVDGLNDSSPDVSAQISRVLAKSGFPFRHGYATKDLLGNLRQLEELLFDRYSEFAVPYGFLLNPQRDLIAIYRGRVPLEIIFHDARNASRSDDELRDLALPFAGRWYTRAYSRLQMLEHFADLTARDAPQNSLFYLERAASEAPPGEARGALVQKLALRHYQRGHKLMSDPTTWDQALHHFNRAIIHNPEFAEAYHARGAIEGNQGKLGAARSSLEKALQLKPGDSEIQRKLTILSRAQRKQP